MKTLLVVSVIIVLILFLAAVLIPNQSSFTKSITFDASIDEVWSIYNDPAEQATWRSEVEKVVMGEDDQSWSEYLKHGNIIINFKIREQIKHQKVVVDMEAKNMFKGEYIALFEPLDENTTKGTFTETSRSLNIPAKIMRFIFANPEKLINKYATEAMKEIERRRSL